jgi:hypothetical protein
MAALQPLRQLDQAKMVPSGRAQSTFESGSAVPWPAAAGLRCVTGKAGLADSTAERVRRQRIGHIFHRPASGAGVRQWLPALQWASLFDGNAANHAVPIMVGTAQIVSPGPAGGEIEILGVAGLHQDLSPFTIEHIGVVDIG